MMQTKPPFALKRVALAALALALSVSACDTHSRAALSAHPDVAPITAATPEFSVGLEAFDGPLPTYAHRGGVFVEGRLGEAYGVRFHNASADRVEVVVTVDGRDVVSGAPGDFESQRGYIVAPWSSVRVDGFRRSLTEVAQFRFSAPEESYASRRGAPENVGVVGVAVFRERRRPSPLALGQGPREASAAEPARAPAAYGDEGASRAGRLGTQYGEDRSAPVSEVDFERLDAQRPDALLAVYYDSRAGLVARGVLPPPMDALQVAPEPSPFPVNGRFAPPPP